MNSLQEFHAALLYLLTTFVSFVGFFNDNIGPYTFSHLFLSQNVPKPLLLTLCGARYLFTLLTSKQMTFFM